MDDPKHLRLAFEVKSEETVALLLGLMSLGGEVGQILDDLDVVLLLEVDLEGVGGEDGSHDGGEAFLLGSAELAVDEADDVELLDGLAVRDGLLNQRLGHGDLGDDLEDVLGLDGTDESLDERDVVLEVGDTDGNGVLSLARN